jgi:RNA polymerase sigma factor (sigma-70 family)
MADSFNVAWIASVFDEHAAALELFAAQWTDSPEDCVQEAVLELARQSVRPDNVAGWLFHVVRLRAISAHRSASRRRCHEALAGRLRQLSGEGSESRYDAQELAIALDSLDDDSRQAVIARTWGELGFVEIGELLGVSASTAFRRYEAALTTMKTKLEMRCATKNNRTKNSQGNCPTT